KSCDSAGCHDTKKRGNIHGNQFEKQQCDECHSVKGFKPLLFKHEDPGYTGYKLEGRHAELKCEKCHRKSVFSGIRHFKPIETKSCDSPGCHDTKERGNVHGSQFKGQKCDSCHTTKGFKKLIFDHNRQSRFVLIGKHKKTECEKCHIEKKWKPLDDTCLACHKKDDKHKGEFGKNCDSCHSAKNWRPENFFHEITGFRLEGAHAQSVCEDCHKVKGEFSGLGSECASCHIEPHFNQFGSDCTDCHTAKNWMPDKFRHSNTGFRLEGAHRNRECEDCHKNRDYRIASPDCVDCHAADFQKATLTIFHQNAITDCQECHRVYSFLPALKHPHQIMTFTGAHLSIRHSCNSCHNRSDWVGSLNGANSESDCNICHAADFTANINAGHGFANSATDCTPCHSTSAWLPIKYSHVSMTFSGAHTPIKSTCSKCHNLADGSLIWPGASTATTANDCVDCHQADFTANPNPAHALNNTDCVACHSGSAWLPASYNHIAMTFTGPHIPVKNSCTTCHQSGSVNLIPAFAGATTAADCAICHATDFTANPNAAHSLGNTNCTDCHSGNLWLPATYNHIAMTFTGAHLVVKNNCTRCHQAGSANLVAEFAGATTAADCATCHLVSDYNPNSGKLGHQTGSTDCALCHNNTAWLPATFAHTIMTFTGVHAGFKHDCTKCHVSGSTNLKWPGIVTSPNDCIVCHQSKFDGEHAGEGKDPNQCSTCHSTSTWNR
ncbi:MAG: cytochrome c3 family protein, partial [Nitrospinota bacterium]